MIQFLLMLLLGFAIACGSTATSTPVFLTETLVAAVTPSTQPLGSSPTTDRKAGTTPQPEAASPVNIPVASPESFPETLPTASVETPRPIEGPIVRVGDAAFPVELAVTVEEQVQGLSDREFLPPGTGMLFVYEREGRHSFWMRDMQFPLDIVWIGAGCTVVDVTLNAPPPEPGQTLGQLPRYSPVGPVRYVLEINAGEFDSQDLGLGDLVQLAGDLAGRYGC